jgi:hypothetical protein
LLFQVPETGDYAISIENQSDDEMPATVRLSASLEFPQVTELSPLRRLTVVAVSLGFFVGVVTFSARKIWRAVNHHRV